MRQQGFAPEAPDRAALRFRGLLFQPTIVATVMLVAIVTQSATIFLLVSGVLWLNVLVPTANPFENLYNRFIARPRGRLQPQGRSGSVPQRRPLTRSRGSSPWPLPPSCWGSSVWAHTSIISSGGTSRSRMGPVPGARAVRRLPCRAVAWASDLLGSCSP